MVQWNTPLGFRDERLLMKLLFNHQVEMVKNKWHHCPDIWQYRFHKTLVSSLKL
jgi:hypothetical protein